MFAYAIGILYHDIVHLPDGYLHSKGNPLDLSRSCFGSLIWLKIRYICTPQNLAYLYERILATKEDNRSKEYLKVHVELCGHFCELRMIATKVRFFLNNSGMNIWNIPSPSVAAVRSTDCVLLILRKITKSYQYLKKCVNGVPYLLTRISTPHGNV